MGADAMRILRTGVIRVACAVCLFGSLLEAQTSPAPTFEVASIKVNKSGDLSGAGTSMPVDRFIATNVPLKQLVQMAYDKGADRLLGGPDWMGSDRFDVNAKAASPFSPTNQWQVMLRALLTDRFKLAVHTESRDAPQYALVMARSDGRLGPNLRTAIQDCAAILSQTPQTRDNDPCGRVTMASALGTGQMRVRGMSMDTLAGAVSSDAKRPVVNKTGLTGSFDWELKWTPQVFLQNAFDRARFASIDPDGPSIFTALSEQLGLKLESERGAIEVLVIDRVEHPTED